jgi:hypothetical protein
LIGAPAAVPTRLKPSEPSGSVMFGAATAVIACDGAAAATRPAMAESAMAPRANPREHDITRTSRFSFRVAAARAQWQSPIALRHPVAAPSTLIALATIVSECPGTARQVWSRP